MTQEISRACDAVATEKTCRIGRYCAAFALVVALAMGCGNTDTSVSADANVDAPDAGPEDLQPFLATIRAQHAIPSLGALVLEGDTIAAIGVDGVRKNGDATLVQSTDRYHIGSCTKAMTATLVGKLVEEGVLSWDATLGGLFPHISAMTEDYADVTVLELLRHRGGVSGNLPQDHLDVWNELWTSDAPISEQRAWFAEQILTKPVPGAVGSFSYSNAGYMLVGAAIERLTGSTWEELMSEKLFEPLGMTACGFGAPSTPGQVDHPWGHSGDSSVSPGPLADNPPALGPAGTVNCSMESWAQFVSAHLAGARGESGYVTAETFARLHEPDADSSYAAGWGVVDQEWAGGQALFHDGSNTMFYATAAVAPGANHALLIVTNRADQPAQEAVEEAVEGLIEAYIAD